MIQLHVLSWDDVAHGRDLRWEDPYGAATLSGEKRQALLENPLATDPEAPCRVVATDGGRVVGGLDLLSGSFDTGEARVPCLWGSALNAPSQTGAAGVGLLLLLKLQELHHTVGACGVSQVAYPIYKRLRWIDCSLPRHVMVIRSKPVLRRYIGDGAIASALAPAADLGLRGARSGLGQAFARGGRRLRAERVEELPPALERQLWPVRATVAAHRSSDWLTWLLKHRFERDTSSRRGLYLVWAGDDAVGYVVVKSRHYEAASQRRLPDLQLGSIQDWGLLNGVGVDAEQLFVLAAQVLTDWAVDAVEACVATHEGVRLRRYGFVPAGALHVLVKARAPSPLATSRFEHAEAWQLRPADGDNFFS